MSCSLVRGVTNEGSFGGEEGRGIRGRHVLHMRRFAGGWRERGIRWTLR